jgi:hypothetical protein
MIEKEQKEKINYLDITIQWKNERSEFSIYRKPTQTDIIVPNSSCHPHKHKLSSINTIEPDTHILNNDRSKTNRNTHHKKHTTKKWI